LDRSGLSVDDLALSYAIAAAEDAVKQVKMWTLYNNGVPPLPDHKWVVTNYDHAGNYDVRISEEPDYTNLHRDHYCFRQYKYQHENKESWNEDKAFELWCECVKNNNLNSVFKLCYFWNINDLIPDSVKLIEIVRKNDK
jgi:hypothetical protein